MLSIFGIVDLIVFGIILVSVLFALYRGLVRELLGISSWLLAGFTALYSYDPLLKALSGHFENVKLAAIMGTVLLALIVLVIMTIINAAITRRLRDSALSGLDRIFGLFFGIARAILIIALIYIFSAAMVLSPKHIEQLKKQNKTIPYIQVCAHWVENIFPENIKKDLLSYQQNKSDQIAQYLKKKKTEKDVVDYKEKDRESLDDLVAGLKELGDLE